jgi:hypothetical protein
MENRNFTVSCKATASQKESYRKKSEQEGLSLSEWIVTILDLYIEKNQIKEQEIDNFNGDVNSLNLKKSEMEKLHNKIINGFQEEPKQQISYSEEEVYKMINYFAFDWNYNYRGELNTKEYLVEWFEKFKKK